MSEKKKKEEKPVKPKIDPLFRKDGTPRAPKVRKPAHVRLKEGRPTMMTLANKEKLLECMEKALGVVTVGCKMAGLNRQNHYNFMEADPDYRERYNALANVALDFAESALHKQIGAGEVASTIFYLKTKGKGRGYVEKVEIEGSIKRDDELKDLDEADLMALAGMVKRLDEKNSGGSH